MYFTPTDHGSFLQRTSDNPILYCFIKQSPPEKKKKDWKNSYQPSLSFPNSLTLRK